MDGQQGTGEAQSEAQSEAASRLYSDAFPNATFVVMEDCTHFCFTEQPEEFARVVGGFLDGVE